MNPGPRIVRDLPAGFIFEFNGRLTPAFEHYHREGVTKVIAGPERCHVVIDVQNPFRRLPPKLTQHAEDAI